MSQKSYREYWSGRPAVSADDVQEAETGPYVGYAMSIFDMMLAKQQFASHVKQLIAEMLVPQQPWYLSRSYTI